MTQTIKIKIKGEPFVLLPKAEYDRLKSMASPAKLPSLPKPAADGSVPAAEFFRASVSREIIARRTHVGWSQQQLADAAGVRVETVCRLETAKHAASGNTVAKIDQALKSAEKIRGKRSR